MNDREKKIEAIQNIINGKNIEKNIFKQNIVNFRHEIENLNWNELRKLATSVNISVNTKRRQEIEKALYAVYMKKNRLRNRRS
tara:strand:- start:1376 stop:1624 length:249 start_codon:yes stop_codon:yes gene_type:complete